MAFNYKYPNMLNCLKNEYKQISTNLNITLIAPSNTNTNSNRRKKLKEPVTYL